MSVSRGAAPEPSGEAEAVVLADGDQLVEDMDLLRRWVGGRTVPTSSLADALERCARWARQDDGPVNPEHPDWCMKYDDCCLPRGHGDDCDRSA